MARRHHHHIGPAHDLPSCGLGHEPVDADPTFEPELMYQRGHHPVRSVQSHEIDEHITASANELGYGTQ